MVESAFVLSILLTLLLAILDVGLAVLHYNSLSEAARWTAREAVVRGEKAAPQRTPWGPESYVGTAADGSEQAAIVRKVLTAADLEKIIVRLEWPDGDNHIDQRVRVTLTYQYDPIVPLPFLQNAYDLKAISTMSITH